ncbi:MAG TPA: hypothetical protein PKX92_09740 [Edaphocola sp.]|nr:hypothetical protein [Edaphocola sp.]
MFALRRFIVLNRLWIALVLIALGVWIGMEVTWWVGWLPILIAILMIVAHFLIGPMTILTKYVENGDIEEAQKLIDSVKKPEWLYSQVRSGFYMLKANLSTMNNNFDQAEEELKKGLSSGKTDKESKGMALLQLGFIASQKGNMKEAYEKLREAVKNGLPDNNTTAQAYMQLSSICAQRRDYRGCKFYFAKAKEAKPTNKEIVDQLKEMNKQIARIPG